MIIGSELGESGRASSNLNITQGRSDTRGKIHNGPTIVDIRRHSPEDSDRRRHTPEASQRKGSALKDPAASALDVKEEGADGGVTDHKARFSLEDRKNSSAIMSHHGYGGATKAERDQPGVTDPGYEMEITSAGNEFPLCGGSMRSNGICIDKMAEFSQSLNDNKEEMEKVNAVMKNPDDGCLPLPETPLKEVECAVQDPNEENQGHAGHDFVDANCHDFFCGLPEDHEEAETFYSSIFCPEKKCATASKGATASKVDDAEGASADAGTASEGGTGTDEGGTGDEGGSGTGTGTQIKKDESEASSFQLLPVLFISALILWMSL